MHTVFGKAEFHTRQVKLGDFFLVWELFSIASKTLSFDFDGDLMS